MIGWSVVTAAAAQASPSGDNCGAYRPGGPEKARLQGDNRARLLAAQTLLAPGLAGSAAVTGLAMLADYQQEMEKLHPDREAAALYLATTSTVPVTVDVLGAVNAALCVAASPTVARAVAERADALRKEMTR